jgi:hypothetical protein
MKRLWRSVILLAICFVAVLWLRTTLQKSLELAKSTNSGGVTVPLKE